MKKNKSTELTILNLDYELLPDNTIEVKLNNLIQEDILERFRIELVTFLRAKLQNDKVNIKTRIVQEKQEQKIYTSQDKLNYFVEKNPKIMDLQKRLGLDIDF